MTAKLGIKKDGKIDIVRDLTQEEYEETIKASNVYLQNKEDGNYEKNYAIVINFVLYHNV